MDKWLALQMARQSLPAKLREGLDELVSILDRISREEAEIAQDGRDVIERMRLLINQLDGDGA